MSKLREGRDLLNGRVILTARLEAFCDQYARDLQRVPILSDTGTDLTLGSVFGPAIIHINDSYYPGWRAKDINTGTELPIFRSNLSNRAIWLPENIEYKLKVIYEPNWLIWVKLLTVVSLAALIAYLLLVYRSARTHKGSTVRKS